MRLFAETNRNQDNSGSYAGKSTTSGLNRTNLTTKWKEPRLSYADFVWIFVLLGAAVKLALGREAGACPLGLEQREDGLYATRTAEQLELKGRWLEALYMPVPAPPD